MFVASTAFGWLHTIATLIDMGSLLINSEAQCNPNAVQIARIDEVIAIATTWLDDGALADDQNAFQQKLQIQQTQKKPMQRILSLSPLTHRIGVR